MESVLVTTTAFTWLGRVERECERYLHLTRASRVFNDGRFGAFVRDGGHANAEIEHVGDARVRIPHTAIVDIVEWRHDLPTEDR